MPQERIRNTEVERLLEAFLSLDTTDEVYALLTDLCTVREIQDMSQRLEVAKMLFAGDSYTDISSKTGASATTIARVSKCLNYGSDGYRTVIEKGE